MNTLLDEIFKNAKSYGIVVEEPACVSVDNKAKFDEWQAVLEEEIEYS